MHMAFGKRDKKWKSIFSYKKIIQNVYDYETLKKRVLSVYTNKNKVLWNKNYHTFQKLVNFRNNSNKLYKLINKKISQNPVQLINQLFHSIYSIFKKG